MKTIQTKIVDTNEIYREMSGLDNISFINTPEPVEMREDERILYRMVTFVDLWRRFSSGELLESYMQDCGYTKERFNATWWKQFKYLQENAISLHSKNIAYFMAVAQFILQPNDADLVQSGDTSANERYTLAQHCALLMSALHPEADHAFFKSIIGDMPEYVRKKEQPRFTQVQELTPDEFAEIEAICSAVLPIFKKNTNRAAVDIIAQYLAERYLQIDPIEKEQPSIPIIHCITPTRYIIPNNKITNALSAGHISFSDNIEDFFLVCVSKSKAKKEIISSIMVSYEGENVQIKGRRPFTEYDRNVYNAIVSLYTQGDPQHIMSPAMIYRAMTGLPDNSNPSPKQIAAVIKSIDKMRFIRVLIDCTEELKQRKVQIDGVPVVNGMLDTYLLNADGAQFSAGGHTIDGYRINQPPVLYEYSRAVNQILSVPADLLAIDASNTESRISVKGYLLRRIEGMKGKNALNSRNILFDSYEKDGKHHPGIYEIAGKPEPSPKDAASIRSFVSSALESWKKREYIKDYSLVKEGKKIVSVKIDIPDEEENPTACKR